MFQGLVGVADAGNAGTITQHGSLFYGSAEDRRRPEARHHRTVPVQPATNPRAELLSLRVNNATNAGMM
jgi:hypothetical protein